jgi:hypothetical protein
VAWLIFPTNSGDVVSLKPLLHIDEVISSTIPSTPTQDQFFLKMIKIKGMINPNVMLKSHKHV